MSQLSVTTIDTPSVLTSLTLSTANSSAGKIVVSNSSRSASFGANTDASFYVTEQTTGPSIGLVANTTTVSVGPINDYPLLFKVNNSEKMRIDTSGRVGIGNNAPSDMLSVNGSGFIGGQLAVVPNFAANTSGLDSNLILSLRNSINYGSGGVSFSSSDNRMLDVAIASNTAIAIRASSTAQLQHLAGSHYFNANVSVAGTIESTTGGVKFPDGTTQTTAATANPAALSTATGSAPSFSARAWVNFDGTTNPPTIRGSGNVSGIVKNSTGNYTISFTTAMPDTNYCAISTSTYSASGPDASPGPGAASFSNFNTGSVTMTTALGTGGTNDKSIISVVIFR